MKLNAKEAILFDEMLTMMEGIEDTNKLVAITLKSLQAIACTRHLKNDKTKKCSEGCPLCWNGICRDITNLYDSYEEEEFE